MFQSARIRLTLYYMIIIMVINTVFSGIIYGMVSQQIEDFIRMQNDRIQRSMNNVEWMSSLGRGEERPPEPPIIDTQQLRDQKRQLLVTLVVVNLGIIGCAGLTGYFLAGKTLRPIKIMIDEQNRFISDSSHELRTPIATLRAEMEASLLERNISDSNARTLIKSNLEELDSLQTLTNRLLQVAQTRIQAKSQRTDVLSLSEILEAAKRKIAPLAKRKRITMKFEETSVLVPGQADKLTELFVILLENAVKYSPEKNHIEITVQPSHATVCVRVIDHGIGIGPTDLPHIFERFYRADKSRSATEGYGLGLSIAQGIARLHGGTISVESSLGKGSSFSISLPLVTA